MCPRDVATLGQYQTYIAIHRLRYRPFIHKVSFFILHVVSVYKTPKLQDIFTLATVHQNTTKLKTNSCLTQSITTTEFTFTASTAAPCIRGFYT